MGKHNGTKTKTDTKVLYKKSNITIRTHSRSCSDASQITKSSILQIKKNLSKTANYFVDGDIMKKDLSVETGACVLRRYYKSKHKRDKCSIQASSAKSKCSTVPTEFTDFKPDHACGDSTNKFEIVDPTKALNIDITSLMVENLKGLLNDWIREHVLEDSETKKKLVNVLDSILQSLEAKIPSTRTSCCTYVIERNGEGYKVRNMKTETNSVTCQYCKQKQTSIITGASSSLLFKKYSRFTLPFPYKHLRIISTLSIPRNMFKKEKFTKKNLVYKVKKMQKPDNMTTTKKKQRKVVINVSSSTMSNVPKKSCRKISRSQGRKSSSKKRGIIFLPQMFYKSTTDFTSTTEIYDGMKNETTQENQLDVMPSLVKSIYADDPANVTSTDKFVNYKNKNDNYTMTEANTTDMNSTKLINSVSNVQFHEAEYECCKRTANTSNVISQRFESHTKIENINPTIRFPNLTLTEQNTLIKKTKKDHDRKKNTYPKKYNKKSRRRSFRKSTPKFNTKSSFESIRYKQFTYLYKKTKNSALQNGDFLNHFRNVFKYFADHKGNRNIKLEIHCNVYPFFEMEENYSKIDTTAYQEYEINMIPTEVCNLIPSVMNIMELENSCEEMIQSPKLDGEIIPILDGAASQAKYIFKSDNSTSTSNHSMKYTESIEKGTAMTGLEVSKELQELRSAVRDFSATAEKLVQEHAKRQSVTSKNESTTSSKKPLEPKSSKVFKTVNKKGTISNPSKGIQFSNTTKGPLLSGIKLSKSPKKIEELTNKLKKRSSSYHVIDSETILKVTDMTASANKSKDSNKPANKKSKSLLNLTKEANKQKLIAFFCDHTRKNNEKIVCRLCSTSNSSFICPGPQQQVPCTNPCCKSQSNTSKRMVPVTVSDPQSCGHDYGSSVYVEIDKPTITVKKKSGLPWWEGCIYCILLWIPVIVIMILFYNYVLVEQPAPKNSTITASKKPKLRMQNLGLMNSDTNSSRMFLKLSDFGF